MKMNALQFLLDYSNASEYEDARDETTNTWLFFAEAMEQYHQSKVNNGVLDDVSNSKEQKPIKYQCLFCNRSFKRKIPHNCKGGFRKRKIEWLPIYE